MKKERFVELLDAFHLSNYVKSPHPEKGGFMLVAGPASFKTTMMSEALRHYANVLLVSDLNVQQLVALKSDIVNKKIQTVAFKEFSKLYERDPRTAANTEGHIRALADEGFSLASFEDQRMMSKLARCVVIGAMTDEFYARNFKRWLESGFMRRFLWASLTLDDSSAIAHSITEGKRISFNGWNRKRLSYGDHITYSITVEEARSIRKLLDDQPGKETPLIFLLKAFCVLRWKYGKDSKEPMQFMKELAPFLTKQGGEIQL